MISPRALLLPLTLVVGLAALTGDADAATRPVAAAPEALARPAPAKAPAFAPAPAPVVAPSLPLPIADAVVHHPVVLVHGMSPTASRAGTDYFGGIAAHLRGLGVEVLQPTLAGVQTIDYRAAQLRDAILAAYPDSETKVNIIAHSAGGLDARYMIAHLGMGDRVASLTTIGTPHRGASLADMAAGILPLSVQDAIDLLMNQIGWDWNQITDMTTAHMQRTFNPATPDDPDVYYQSFAGVVWPRAGLPLVLAPSWGLVLWFEGANDGVVSVASARWGTFRGTVPADHMAQVGRRDGRFDHRAFFEAIVRDLGTRGL